MPKLLCTFQKKKGIDGQSEWVATPAECMDIFILSECSLSHVNRPQIVPSSILQVMIAVLRDTAP